MALKYNAANPNTTWINSNGFIAFYLVLVVAVHLILLSVPLCPTEWAWTCTNALHSLVRLSLSLSLCVSVSVCLSLSLSLPSRCLTR